MNFKRRTKISSAVVLVVLALSLFGCKAAGNLPDTVWSENGSTSIFCYAKSFKIITGSGRELVSEGGELAPSELIRRGPDYLTGSPAMLDFDLQGCGSLSFVNEGKRASDCYFMVQCPDYSACVSGTGVGTALFSAEGIAVDGEELELKFDLFPFRDMDKRDLMICLKCSGDKQITILTEENGITVYQMTGAYELYLTENGQCQTLSKENAGNSPVTFLWSEVLPKEYTAN